MEPFTTWLKTHDDNTTIIGPFKTQEELDRFLEIEGRVFSSDVTVYTPQEWLEQHQDEDDEEEE